MNPHWDVDWDVEALVEEVFLQWNAELDDIRREVREEAWARTRE